MSRKDAREKAMQLLYQLESQKDDQERQIRDFLEERTPLPEKADEALLSDDVDKTGKPSFVPLRENDRQYLEALVRHVLAHAPELDAVYAPYLVNWKPERLPRIERILLRMAVSEIQGGEVPDSVAINEAVRLCRKYAAEESYSYINAVLGNICRDKEKQRPKPEKEKNQKAESEQDQEPDHET